MGAKKITDRRIIKISGLLFALLLMLGAACSDNRRPETGEPNPMPQRDINEVMEAHVQEWMAIPGVVGVYIGMLDDEKTLCIKVMVIEKTEELARRFPNSVENYPLVLEETGVIRPL